MALLKDLLAYDKEYSVRAEVLETISDLLDRRLLASVREAAVNDVDPRIKRRAMDVALRLSDASSVEKALSEVKDDLERVKSENRDLRERSSRMRLA